MLRSVSEALARAKADTNFKASIMHSPKIHTFNPKNQTSDFDVYILCKGLNSGKPLEKPCPNCFVISCKSSDEMDFYKTLSFGLWKVKHFHQFLTFFSMVCKAVSMSNAISFCFDFLIK